MLNIVMPLAGRGSRFAQAGFLMPKPLVPVCGVPMVQRVIENVRPRDPNCRFIFLCLREHIDQYNLHCRLEEWESCPVIISVDSATQGAACTILLARFCIDTADPLLIVNGDQLVDVSIDDFLMFMRQEAADGYIMTFPARDPKWSYVRRDSAGRVCEVVEKEVVSDEATVGIYAFRQGRMFVEAADQMIYDRCKVNGEYFVAPSFNYMIRKGLDVQTWGIPAKAMHGLGTPEDLAEYERSHYDSAIA